MRLSDLVIANLRDFLQLSPAFPLRHVAKVMHVPEMHIEITGIGKVCFRTTDSDACVIRQVFRDHDYDISPFPQSERVARAYQEILSQNQTPVFVDAGANIGASSVWFAKTFPRAVILAVEPQKQNASLCRRNVARYPNVKVVEAAIGATPGQVSIVDEKQESWAYQTQRNSNGTIPIVTVPELVASIPNGRLFAAKIDIEGFEADVFANNTDWLYDLSFLFLEPHDWMLPGAGTSRGFQQRFASGFELLITGENLLYIANRSPSHALSPAA